mgnify:CR=1 FL=1|tara:strand:+ start:2365 stop:2664 length:300 start_codon:yes stop_codon:yes gene_type:complete
MKITIEISQDNINQLADAIAARLGGAAPVVEEPAPVVEEVAPAMSLGDLRGLAKDLVKAKGAKGRDALVSILAKAGAKNLTTLDEAKFADVAEQIRGGM